MLGDLRNFVWDPTLAGGAMKPLIKKKPSKWTLGIISGLAYLNKNDIIHGDLKPSNVL